MGTGEMDFQGKTSGRGANILWAWQMDDDAEEEETELSSLEEMTSRIILLALSLLVIKTPQLEGSSAVIFEDYKDIGNKQMES